jgi:hypothetical protein
MTTNLPVVSQANGRSRYVLRGLWLLTAVGYLALLLTSLPNFYQRASTLTIEPYYLGEPVSYDNATAQQDASERGFSPQTNAIFEIAFTLFQLVVYYLLTALIAWRTTTGFGQFTAFVLLFLSIGTLMGHIVEVAHPFLYANLLLEIPGYLIWPAWLGWLYLFPNGRPVPRRTLWPMVLILSSFMASQLLSLLAVAGILPPQILALGNTFGPFVALLLLGLVLYSQIYRYRYVSTLLERQQLKWFLFGLGLFFGFLAVFILFPEPVRDSAVTQDILAFIFLIFPVAVALAVLRYRLFDVDILIRKTVKYGVLTAVLGLVYYGSVLLLQGVFTRVTGEGSAVALVLSTLLIAALFTPSRRRIQGFIDGRFFRKKYNAQQVLDDFAQTARDEVDMEALQTELLRVVQETMQPQTITLWLKSTDH